MKTIVLPPRKIYKFSHSIGQGGFLYSHKIQIGRIQNKDGLRNMLQAVGKQFKLIDVTVKIYDDIFFFFFLFHTARPVDLINKLQEHLHEYGEFTSDYLYTTVYDLQEEYLRKDLKEYGFDYDKG
ncbi:MAG: hypothetical protein ABIJ21_05855 [Nanoarchaeota archaeon]